jgi:CheY-like chemotaxis protein
MCLILYNSFSPLSASTYQSECLPSLFGYSEDTPLMQTEPRSGRMADCVVLHVEDSDTDAYLFRLALQEADIPAAVYRVSDGEQAMLLLHKLGSFTQAPTPALIFLDLNMPKMNGWEVLTAMQQSEQLRQIPVVVLTTSSVDKERVLALGAREYICKSHNFDEFLADVQTAYQLCMVKRASKTIGGAA